MCYLKLWSLAFASYKAKKLYSSCKGKLAEDIWITQLIQDPILQVMLPREDLTHTGDFNQATLASEGCGVRPEPYEYTGGKVVFKTTCTRYIRSSIFQRLILKGDELCARFSKKTGAHETHWS